MARGIWLDCRSTVSPFRKGEMLQTIYHRSVIVNNSKKIMLRTAATGSVIIHE